MGGVPKTPKDRRENVRGCLQRITNAARNGVCSFIIIIIPGCGPGCRVSSIVNAGVAWAETGPGGARVIFAAVVQEQDASLPGRRSGCKSRQPHHFISFLLTHGGGSTRKARVSKTRFMQARYLAAVPVFVCSFLTKGPWLDKEGTCLASRHDAGAIPAGSTNFGINAEREAWASRRSHKPL